MLLKIKRDSDLIAFKFINKYMNNFAVSLIKYSSLIKGPALEYIIQLVTKLRIEGNPSRRFRDKPPE